MTEAQLNTALKSGSLSRVYFFYGKETFLVKTYADKVISKAVTENDRDFNLIRFEGNAKADEFGEAAEELPVFAEKKAVVINDLDAEKMDAATLNKYIEILSDLPKTTVVVIYITGFEPDAKKAKTKKLINALEKLNFSAVIEFNQLPPSKIAEMIIKKAARSGCVISKENALYLSELTLRDLNLISAETDKLCAYVGENGEITRDTINRLVSGQFESNIYELAEAITGKNSAKAFGLLDGLLYESYQPVVILATLAGSFTDFYRVKLAQKENVPQDKIASDFSYAKNRIWLIGKTAKAVRNVGMEYIRSALEILSAADIKLKSSPLGNRIILEKALAELLLLKL